MYGVSRKFLSGLLVEVITGSTIILGKGEKFFVTNKHSKTYSEY